VSRNSTIAQQNDPHELLEVFDAAGRPTGRAKSRAAVHIDGDWHQAFHCWILRHAQDARGPQIVLQRRAASKDTFPSCWDAAAAGHWRFGETPQEAAREIAEELGVEVDFAALRYMGRERLARSFPNGLIDREHHQVYLLRSDAELRSYRPDPREVSALAAFAATDLIMLLSGRRARIGSAEGIAVSPAGDIALGQFEVGREDVVPYSVARLRRILG
jgi:isopentenyldiphosphate isomerase